VEAFEAFFEREYARVCRSLFVVLGDMPAAEEAAQEAFVKAWLRWPRVAAMERPASWVYVVASRQAFRARRRTLPDENGTTGAVSDVADAVVDRLAQQRRLVDVLTPRQRLVIVLRFHCDLRLDEIAEAAGTSLGTVKSTLHAALTRLRVDAMSEEQVRDGH